MSALASLTDALSQCPARPSAPTHELTVLIGLARELADADPDPCSSVVHAALRLCEVESAALSICEPGPGGTQLRWQAVAGRICPLVGSAAGDPKTSLCAHALAEKGVHLFIEPGRSSEEFRSFEPPVQEALATAILVRDTAVGTLWLFSHNGERCFDAEDAARLERLASLAASAYRIEVSSSEVSHTRQLSERRLALLWQAAQVLLTAENPDEMLHRLFDKIKEELGVDTYFNFMVDERGEALTLASTTGIPEKEQEKIKRLDFGQAICGTVALERVSIVATDIQYSDDPKVQLVKGYGIRAYACNPLMSGEKLLGTLSFATHTRDSFSSEDLDFSA